MGLTAPRWWGQDRGPSSRSQVMSALPKMIATGNGWLMEINEIKWTMQSLLGTFCLVFL